MDNTSSSLNGDKNPFAELSSMGGSGGPNQPKRAFHLSLLTTAFALRIAATVVVGLAAVFALDAFIRSSEVAPSFVPATFARYLSLGVEGETNPEKLSLKQLVAKYSSESQALLTLYGDSVTDVTYQRSLVEFFDKNPEVEFIQTQNADKYNILTLIDEFGRMTQSRNEYAYITYDCNIESISDAGSIKATCDIYSSASPFAPGTKSPRVVAAELLENFGSKESKFILKNTPKSLALQETSEGAFKSKTMLSLELQALPSLLP